MILPMCSELSINRWAAAASASGKVAWITGLHCPASSSGQTLVSRSMAIAAFSATDFTEDLKKFDKPTLIVHGDDDQIVPIDAAGRASKKLVPHAVLKVYEGAPHGLSDTHKDRLNQDLLDFLRE